MLDLRIVHHRWATISNPSINGHLHYPVDIDRTLNETTTDKILQYRDDYNNRPSHTISFIPTIVSTAGRLHCEFVLLLYLQSHRETDRFLADSGVQPSETNFHVRRVSFKWENCKKTPPISSKTFVHFTPHPLQRVPKMPMRDL